MNNKSPTPRESQLLLEVYQSINLHRKFPNNEILSKILHVKTPRVSYIKNELKKKGYLVGAHGNEKLTEKAIKFLTGLEEIPGFRSVVSTFIPLAGEVSAGKGNMYDDLAVYLDNGQEPTDQISIPNLGNASDKNIVALRVRGVSMESAGILDGDYVLVELKNKDEFMGIKEGQFVVTEYLSKADEALLTEDLIDPSDLPLVGYTLKVYRGNSLDKDGNKFYKLGKLKDYGQANLHEIKTRVIRPIGKVIGVYRDISTG